MILSNLKFTFLFAEYNLLNNSNLYTNAFALLMLSDECACAIPGTIESHSSLIFESTIST